jgi:alpha-galactosidase
MDALIALRAAGVGLLLDISAGQLPAVLHWGADLGEVGPSDWEALRRAQQMPVMNNGVDVPLRLALVPEGRAGWMGRPGLSGSRGGRDWSPRFEVVELEVDGQPVTVGVHTSGAGSVRVACRDEGAELELELLVELTPQGLLRTRAGVRNLGAEAYQVDELLVALPVPGQARELLDFTGRWTKERQPQRLPLVMGEHRRENRRGRTGADAAHQLCLGTRGFGHAGGAVWAVHTAWSGNHVHYAERVNTGQQVIGGGELLLPGEVILGQGEQYLGPWVYASHGEGLDNVAARFHDWMRARPQHPASARPVTLNVWEAVYFDHRLDKLLELVDRAAEVGVERFVLDDGWFGGRRDDTAGLGDWWVSPQMWPDGLDPLISAVKAKGMQFGLWVEPEMVNMDSDLARAHPEWVMQTGGRLPVESRHQQVLNLAIPQAYAQVRDQLSEILRRYEIDYLKWDHNRDLVDAGSAGSGRPAVHAQTLAAYRLMDELRAVRPGLEIESCASGGARVDLEVLQRTDRVWASDCIDALERQQIDWWTKQLIPPELVGSHIASVPFHTTGRILGLPMRAATAVFGHLGIEWDITQAGPEELAVLKGWIDWHKQHRALLHSGRMVRLDWPDDELRVHGMVDDSGGIFSVAMVAMPGPMGLGLLPLPGLEPQARYRVQVVFADQIVQLPQAWQAAPIELSGAQLAAGVLRAPVMFTDQVLVVEARRVRADTES